VHCSFNRNIILTRARRHVIADLRPYVCVVENCDADHMNFASRTEFAAHLREHEYENFWRCSHCGHTSLERTAIEAHVTSSHFEMDFESHRTIVEEKMMARNLSTQKCPFCGDIPGATKFVGHLCHHLEEISISAIPQDVEPDDENHESFWSGAPSSLPAVSYHGDHLHSDDKIFDPDNVGQHSPPFKPMRFNVEPSPSPPRVPIPSETSESVIVRKRK
jgi:hypothetical protein